MSIIRMSFAYCIAILLAATVTSAASPAMAQSFRPIPASVTLIPYGDDHTVSAVLPFSIKIGTPVATPNVEIGMNGEVRISTLNLTAPFDDLISNATTGQAHHGSSTVNGRPAYIITYPNVGYFLEPAKRANLQVVIIDRSDISPGDFDVEWNTEGMERAGMVYNFIINGASVGRAGVSAFPSDSNAYRAVWSIRSGGLTSGVGPADPASFIVPEPIPTLSEWGLILLGVLLAAGAGFMLQRRRRIACT